MLRQVLECEVRRLRECAYGNGETDRTKCPGGSASSGLLVTRSSCVVAMRVAS